MCGICGIVNYRDADVISGMSAALEHRGPDDVGRRVFSDEKIALGFRRLAVIDPTPASNQPMSSEDGKVSLVYNGEIYNYRELRRQLEAKGRRFRTSSDTEVLLTLYEEEGPGAVENLNGMFAFAMIDRRQGKLLLARDRLGIKPLYYSLENGRFVFASEIKGVLASGLVPAETDPQAVADYFTFGYVPGPATIFRGIRQVLPAHTLELDLKTLETKIRRYWRPGPGPQLGDPEAAERLRDLLSDSVARQLISDVPIGIFLSGGVDSCILTAMAAAHSRAVKTFTCVFEQPAARFFNEEKRAALVADRFGTRHSAIPVDMHAGAGMLDLLRYFDQPFANPTFLLMHLISQKSRGDITVGLCGAGGDELFAGYPRYRAGRLARKLEWIPDPAFRFAGKALGPLTDSHRSPALHRARQFVEGWSADPVERQLNWTYFLGERKKDLLSPFFSAHSGLLPARRIFAEAMEESAQHDEGNRILDVDLRTFLPYNVLEYTDRMSMAASQEVRVPFLDHEVVEFAMTVPFEKKLRRGRTKHILKQACRDLIPKEVLDGPKKGFNVPLALWMRDGLDGYFDANLDEGRVERGGIFEWKVIQQMREEHRRGRRDNAHELFSIVAFDSWQQRYIERRQPDLPAPAAGKRGA